ncbi:histone-lysine N-methyltransferase SETMAR-like [Anabrus simplex]|uniref:histone-lysine N-methyltransferase SETMAR-like n=1 Tax=Anabrus simplex TaxID=316456 RepID=UPI0035A2F6E5
MDVSKVHSWVRQFNEGRTSCDNKPKQPRAHTSRSDDMIEKVERIVLGDHRMTVEQIASSVGISVGSVHTILHDDLKMRKVSSRWVPRMLTDDHKAAHVACCQAMLTRNDSMNGTFFSSIVTMDETWMPFFNPETKRQSAQWKHTDSPPPKKFRVTASAEKMMVSIFWDSEGVILTHCVPKGTTVTGASYENVLKNKFLPALQQKRPGKAARVLFHQDNAPAHRANVTQTFLRENNFEVTLSTSGILLQTCLGSTFLAPPRPHLTGYSVESEDMLLFYISGAGKTLQLVTVVLKCKPSCTF